jgi:hypothetical protein
MKKTKKYATIKDVQKWNKYKLNNAIATYLGWTDIKIVSGFTEFGDETPRKPFWVGYNPDDNYKNEADRLLDCIDNKFTDSFEEMYKIEEKMLKSPHSKALIERYTDTLTSLSLTQKTPIFHLTAHDKAVAFAFIMQFFDVDEKTMWSKNEKEI